MTFIFDELHDNNEGCIMVMMSVRVKAILATVGRANGDKLRKSLEKKFGNIIRTRWKGRSLIIEGDAFRDWRVREWIHGRLGAS